MTGSSSARQYLTEASVLATVVCAAFALRWIGFVNTPFHGDETFSLGWSRDWWLFLTTLDYSHVDYLRYPLYFAMTAPILQVVEDQVLANRVVAFVTGVLAVPVVYGMLRRRFGFGVAMGCATVLALHPQHVSMSAFGRYYTLLFLLGTVSMLLFLAAVENRSVARFTAALVLLLLAVLAFPGALLLAPAPMAFLAYLGVRAAVREGTVRNLHWDRFAKVAACALAVVLLGGGLFAARILWGWSPVGVTHLGYSMSSLLVGYAIRFGVPVCILGGAALVHFARTDDPPGAFFALWAALPPALLAILALAGLGTAPHYLLAAGLGPIILAVYYVSSVVGAHRPAGSGRNLLLAAVLAVLAFGPAVQLASYFQDYDAPDYRAAVNVLGEDVADTGCIVITTSIAYPAYYASEAGWEVVTLCKRSSVAEVLGAVKQGRMLVLHSIWLFDLPHEQLARFQAKLDQPCWFIETTRNGLDPHLPRSLPVYRKRRDPANPDDYYAAFDVDPAHRVAAFFSFDRRVGHARFDHRHNELLVYRMNEPAGR